MTSGEKHGNKPGKSGTRSERLAAALRANLKRRKAQERGRQSEGQESGDRESGNWKERIGNNEAGETEKPS